MSTPAKRRLDLGAYTVALICPLEEEMSAARYMLDEEHEMPQNATYDKIFYILGQLSGHNVVIASLPDGSQGTVSAAVIAIQLSQMFPAIKLRLLVGIGGGVPSGINDVHLGDVVVSTPVGSSCGVIAYDLGKENPSGFERKGFLCPPPTIWRNVMIQIKSDHRIKPNRINEFLSEMLRKYPELEEYRRPLPETDILFQSNYRHNKKEKTCAKCSKNRVVVRPPRAILDRPVIFYGLIASGNRVIRDAIIRDKISNESGGALCFEMEAAGLMNDFQCLVIRGISDYCDDHKNDDWRHYAAAVAAGFAKEILSYMVPIHRHVNSEDDVKCLRDLYKTNPEDDKKRIEWAKGGLIKEVYSWILKHDDFQAFCENPDIRMLLVKGSPGKGKTMLLCGIIDELKEGKPYSGPIVHFFCQGADSRVNSATSILRGLIYMLVIQKPFLISHVRKEYDPVGEQLFEGANVLVALFRILTNILRDPHLNAAYLIIDALDECETDLLEFLDYLVQMVSALPNIKWVLSSRNITHIEEKLEQVTYQLKLSLELNEAFISDAVNFYILHKLQRLTDIKKYDETLQNEIRKYLLSNADNTFLWVALVCQYIEKIPKYQTLRELRKFPPGLDAVYQRIIDQLSKLNDDLCKQVLTTMTVTYRPITLNELTVLAGIPQYSNDIETLREAVELCGSFLTIRGNTVYFIHQSAKEFLATTASDTISPSGLGYSHYIIFSKSIHAMYETLRRDIYDIRSPGCLISQIEPPKPDPLASIRYSCVYWARHLSAFASDKDEKSWDASEVSRIIDQFLRQKYLHWLEALSLLRMVPNGVVSINILGYTVHKRIRISAILHLVRDAQRFIQYHRPAIELSPLQVYASALVFSPTHSLIRKAFREDYPVWIVTKPAMDDFWSPCVHTHDLQSQGAHSIAFSHDKRFMATGGTAIQLWDTLTGVCIQTIHSSEQPSDSVNDEDQAGGEIPAGNESQGSCELSDFNEYRFIDGSNVVAVAFTQDNKHLVAALTNGTVNEWSVQIGKLIKSFQIGGGGYSSSKILLSHNGTRLVSASNSTIQIWDISNEDCIRVLDCHDHVSSITLSQNGEFLAATCARKTFYVWHVSTGRCQYTARRNSNIDQFPRVALSPSGRLLALAAADGITIRKTMDGSLFRSFSDYNNWISCLAFLPGGTRLASGSDHANITIWDVVHGTCIQVFDRLGAEPSSITFSYDGAYLASAAFDGLLRVWDLTAHERAPPLEHHENEVSAMKLSHDKRCLATSSTSVPGSGHTVMVWDAASGIRLRALAQESTRTFALSCDGKQVVTVLIDGSVEIWETASGACLQSIKKQDTYIIRIALSPDGSLIAVDDGRALIQIFDSGSTSGEYIKVISTTEERYFSIALSQDNRYVAVGCYEVGIVEIWEVGTRQLTKTFAFRDRDTVTSITFSEDSRYLAAASGDCVQIWDIVSGECRYNLQPVHQSQRYISFDATGAFLYTNGGTIALDLPSTDIALHPTKPKYHGYGFDLDYNWITWNSENLLWLPPEYRPSSLVVGPSTVSIGCRTGRVLIFNFSDSPDIASQNTE
ncbi:hypothetical protein F5884DRAFT_105145 [Xylogone sp. PMI_703]|nr:hypothetical protein F5884DRAFT_105145 [Xylogone sp. PMI_703]